VDVQNILAAHRTKTAERAGQQRTVLAIQDTSSLGYTSHRQTRGLGQLSLKKGKPGEKLPSPGLVMPSCLAVTTEGLPLGVLEQQIFARAAGPADLPQPRHVLSIEEKESSRWLASLKNAQPVPGETQLVTGCDREADIDELVQLSAALAAPVVVRANSERPITQRSRDAEKGIVKLWPQRARHPCAGRFAREVPARRGPKHTTSREPRVATVEVRFVAFTLNPPKRLSSPLPTLAMSAIDVREKDPPAGEPPREGRLLPNLPIENFAQA